MCVCNLISDCVGMYQGHDPQREGSDKDAVPLHLLPAVENGMNIYCTDIAGEYITNCLHVHVQVITNCLHVHVQVITNCLHVQVISLPSGI